MNRLQSFPGFMERLLSTEKQALGVMCNGEIRAEKYKAQQKFYKAVLQIIEGAQIGFLQ